MKRVFSYFLLVGSSLFFLYSCTKSTDSTSDIVGNWVRRSDFDGVARSEAVSFVIGDTAYIATGYDGTNRLNDLWKYDVGNNYWIQRGSLPGAARSSAVGFSTTTKGYISTGFDGLNKLQDTWEFNPLTNVWAQKANFGGSARIDAVAFGIGDKGYVTTGNDGNDLKDFWQFDPNDGTLGKWTQKVSLGGSKRSAAVAFVYKGIGYVATGINNGQTVNDFWSYDPSADKWTEKRFITNVSDESYDDDYTIVRSNATAFIMADRAYVCTGENGSILKTVWEYDFANDVWTKKTDWEGLERTGAVSFGVKNRGFLVTGRNSTYRFDDMREFFPTAEYDEND